MMQYMMEQLQLMIHERNKKILDCQNWNTEEEWVAAADAPCLVPCQALKLLGCQDPEVAPSA